MSKTSRALSQMQKVIQSGYEKKSLKPKSKVSISQPIWETYWYPFMSTNANMKHEYTGEF